MPNPLFENQTQPGNQGIFGLIKQLKTGNVDGIFNEMYQTNPQFRDFANSVKGKSPEQAFQEQGFDFSPFKNMMH
jgi:hypothetical protein